jgi:hypothetical protein
MSDKTGGRAEIHRRDALMLMPDARCLMPDARGLMPDA